MKDTPVQFMRSYDGQFFYEKYGNKPLIPRWLHCIVFGMGCLTLAAIIFGAIFL